MSLSAEDKLPRKLNLVLQINVAILRIRRTVQERFHPNSRLYNLHRVNKLWLVKWPWAHRSKRPCRRRWLSIWSCRSWQMTFSDSRCRQGETNSRTRWARWFKTSLCLSQTHSKQISRSPNRRTSQLYRWAAEANHWSGTISGRQTSWRRTETHRLRERLFERF